MHAVLITFRSSAPLEELEQPFKEYAERLCAFPGLISKTWIRDGETLGGFHVFIDRDAADAYLTSDMAAGLIAMPMLDDFKIDHYEVFEEFSVTTGTPTRELAAIG